jgi:uncharacterized protein YdhG (YjbR/CyaY superfamily)
MGERCTKVDAYLEESPTEDRAALEDLRVLIHEIHPTIKETIQYKTPTFTLEGEMVTGFASRANTSACTASRKSWTATVKSWGN